MKERTDKEILFWAIKDWTYSKIRFLFVDDIDANEDFYCGECDEPVLTRVIFCSLKCEQANMRANK